MRNGDDGQPECRQDASHDRDPDVSRVIPPAVTRRQAGADDTADSKQFRPFETVRAPHEAPRAGWRCYVLVQDQLVVTETDGRRLQRMIGSLRESLRTIGDPYEIYLRALEDQLARRSLVPQADVDVDVVTMNSKVRVRELDTGRSQVMTLVYERDADVFGEKVSVLAPLGAAILGSRVGDVVEWQSRRGPRRVRIERILFQPEAAGEFHL